MTRFHFEILSRPNSKVADHSDKTSLHAQKKDVPNRIGRSCWSWFNFDVSSTLEKSFVSVDEMTVDLAMGF